jgi:hypothetical protein
MKLRILKDGTYNNTEHRARLCKAGDVLETGTVYGQSLIASGYAEEANQRGSEEAEAQSDDAQIEETNSKAAARLPQSKRAKR